MANNAFRHPANTAVAQVWKGTITTTTNGHTYIVTLTLDNGDTAAITYTVVNPPDTTVTLVATGFITAWNASTNPTIAGITATQSAGQIILTSDTAGVPFSAAATGTGTWSGTGNTTSNVGNNDFSTARNWQLDAVPIATNDVLFEAATSNVSVTYGLNQSSVAIAALRVFPGCSSSIGRFENGLGFYYRSDPDLFRYEGSGSLAMFDIGSANIDAYINATGTPGVTGRNTVYIKGSNIATLTVVKGSVGIAALDADTATVATLKIGYVTTQASDAAVTVGSGVTLTTLDQGGGTCTLKCAATTVTCGATSTLTTEGSGALTTLHVYGTCYSNSTGTITTANVYDGGILDLTRVRSARTITTVNVHKGGTLKIGTWVTLTNKIAPGSNGVGSFTVTWAA